MAQSFEQSTAAPTTGRTPQTTQTAGPAPDAGPGEANRLLVFLHALFFVLGFGVVFTLLGSVAGLIGPIFEQYLQRMGAILLVLFGLTTLGVFRWLVRRIQAHTDLRQNPAAAALVSILDFFNVLLYTEKRVTNMHQVGRKWGLFSSALLGVSFSAGWVPCIGPILASIFFLASGGAGLGGGVESRVIEGATLLAIYSLGLGVPFLVVGLAFSRASNVLRRLNRHAGIVSIISGIFLFYVAYLLWTERLVQLTTQFSFLNEWVFAMEETVTAATGAQGDIIGLSVVAASPLAFFAGLISFLSPCVLPLVPAYIGYLSSAALGAKR